MTVYTDSAAPTAASNRRSHGRAMQWLGGLWFLALAILVAQGIGSSPSLGWPSLLSSFCLAVFYLLLGLLVLTRPPPRAQTESWLPKAAAFAGSYLPWTISLFSKTEQALPNLASSACVLVGAVMMLVTIRHLGRSFSIVPQAHAVVRTGPYRWIRHPLYLFEEIAIVGVVLQNWSPAAVAILVAHVCLQIYRIYYEEDLLRRHFPEYASYEASRWRLIPYVW